MNVKETLLETLAGSDGEYISGAMLAEKIGVSRNAVWKAVKSLETEGYSIEAVTSKGYRLSAENNRLSEKLIQPFLKTEDFGKKIVILEETDSTNNYAKEIASSGALHGTVVIADSQSSGKGRLGRSFVSPKGKGLYMSVVVRPDFDIQTASMITSATACAVAVAVEKLCRSEVNIKWVNDLYMNGRKICGILTEASLGMEMKSIDYAVIGIGINVRSAGGGFSRELRVSATSVEDETGLRINRNRLCAEVLNSLEKYLSGIESRNYIREYRNREILTGNTITANVDGSTVIAFAEGIDDNANLVIKLPDGTIRHLSSGEANLCRVIE
ncbi:MAG: biotin--[acetyl-CoA-carboxylase] ligase [Ruminococcus sp.]|nr:biotin--[acetyl-CoA-carboxylase] ligase [Ruminococcus sp.]MDE6678489.1 biotin--[acetyl-CoA-carboxylase] ligase [Ruminococcus sp.]